MPDIGQLINSLGIVPFMIGVAVLALLVYSILKGGSNGSQGGSGGGGSKGGKPSSQPPSTSAPTQSSESSGNA